RARDGHRQQRQHQDLLAPLTAEQPPRPADHSPARRSATVGGPPVRRSLSEEDTHRDGSGARSDSGPRGGEVWSTTRPSRRNTTRSAHDASWASWVTTTPASPRRHAACTRRITDSALTESTAPARSPATAASPAPTTA